VTAKTERDILLKFEGEGKKKGLTPRFLEFYQRLIRIQSRAEKQIGRVKANLSGATVNERMSRGVSLLNFKELSLDWALLREVLTQVTATFADYTDLYGELPERLSGKKMPLSLPRTVVRAWYNRNKLPATVSLKDANEYILFEAIIHAALKPFLSSQAKALHSLIDQEHWRQSYCPICHGQPDFSYLDKENGTRWLICSRCDAEWIFQRLQCPYCGTENQDALTYYIDDEGRYRLYVCEQCHKYLKTLDLRPGDELGLPIPFYRVLTLDMDRQAQEMGYQPVLTETEE